MPKPIFPSCMRSLTAGAQPPLRSNMLVPSSPALQATPSRISPAGWNVTGPRSGASAVVTSRADWKDSCWTNLAWGARRRFPPLQRARVVELACLEPIAEGLHITHWTPHDLARQAVVDG